MREEYVVIASYRVNATAISRVPAGEASQPGADMTITALEFQ